MTPAPLAYREQEAAKALSMTPAQFRQLVSAGALPPPVSIGNLKRWRRNDLEAMLDGQAAKPEDRFEL